jgi:hypothetical protein
VLLPDLDAALCEDCLANGNAVTHGTRRTYQDAHCRCPPCTAANTQYSADYRSGIRAGRPPLGAHVANLDVDRAIARLVTEGFSKATIARALGYQTARLQYRAGVTLRTVLRVRLLERAWTT